MIQQTDSTYLTGQIHLENGVYLTVQVNIWDNFIYQLQNAIYPCRIYSDPDMVAGLIAGEFIVLSIGSYENLWDVFVSLNAHDQTVTILIKQEDEITSLFSGSFTTFLSISQDEITMIWDTYLLSHTNDISEEQIQ